MIKCLILKIGIILISEIQEIGADVGEPDCQLTNPFEVLDNGDLRRWPVVTDQRTLLTQSDSILTIVDPNDEVLKKYKEAIK